MMAIRFSLATLLFVFIIGFSISDLTPTPSPNLVKKKPPSRLPPPPPPPPTHFEHFMMVQRWPKTYCLTVKCSKDIHQPTEFVIHGLWPANRVLSDPRGCLDKTNQQHIDFGNFPLKQDLDKVWPDLKVYEKSESTRNIAFWNEQWKVHGSCSNMDINDFFKLSLVIYKKIGSLKDVLGKEGYSPGPQSHIEKQKIVDIIKKHTDGKASPRITCEKHDGKTYLHEIQVCVDKTEDHKYTNCRSPDLIDCEKDVYFP